MIKILAMIMLIGGAFALATLPLFEKVKEAIIAEENRIIKERSYLLKGQSDWIRKIIWPLWRLPERILSLVKARKPCLFSSRP